MIVDAHLDFIKKVHPNVLYYKMDNKCMLLLSGSDTLAACEDGHLLAVRKYWTLLQQEKLPTSILNIAVWVSETVMC